MQFSFAYIASNKLEFSIKFCKQSCDYYVKQGLNDKAFANDFLLFIFLFSCQKKKIKEKSIG